MSPQKKPWQERFWPKIQKSDGCWIWTACKDLDGYGQFQLESKRGVRAHRLMYETQIGPIPPGYVIMHSCDNPPCVRPEHLSAAPDADNIADRNNKGRTSKGARHYAAKLTEGEVADLRRRALQGEKVYRIHAEYGISYSQAKAIVAGRKWKPTGVTGAAQDTLVKDKSTPASYVD